jgi:DNA polymerase-3 subunit alpha
MPIMWRRPQDGAIITQFDYPMCESLGLVKMDFLGLRNLTDPRRRAGQHRGESRREVVLEELPFDDRSTYALLGRGDTLGVFQLDGSGRCAHCCGRCSPTSSPTSRR